MGDGSSTKAGKQKQPPKVQPSTPKVQPPKVQPSIPAGLSGSHGAAPAFNASSVASHCTTVAAPLPIPLYTVAASASEAIHLGRPLAQTVVPHRHQPRLQQHRRRRHTLRPLTLLIEAPERAVKHPDLPRWGYLAAGYI